MTAHDVAPWINYLSLHKENLEQLRQEARASVNISGASGSPQNQLKSPKVKSRLNYNEGFDSDIEMEYKHPVGEEQPTDQPMTVDSPPQGFPDDPSYSVSNSAQDSDSKAALARSKETLHGLSMRYDNLVRTIGNCNEAIKATRMVLPSTC